MTFRSQGRGAYRFAAMSAAAPEVALRRFEPGDVAAVHRWFNNREATATLMEQRAKFSEQDARAWVERAMDESGEDRKYAILVDGHEEPVGFTALYGLFRQTAPELGALIGDDVRGKGVGRRAEALTIAKAFDEFGAHRVYGRIPAHNEAAKRVVTSLGWKHEGTMRGHLRGDGGLADCEVWGVLPDEFRAAAADLL
jgi:RimJ/RimL family protein N-acetyltransferase